MHPFVYLYRACSTREYQILIDLEEANAAPCPFIAAVFADDSRVGLTRAAVEYRASAERRVVPSGDHVGERWLDGLRQLINKPKKLGRVRRGVDAWGTIQCAR